MWHIKHCRGPTYIFIRCNLLKSNLKAVNLKFSINFGFTNNWTCEFLYKVVYYRKYYRKKLKYYRKLISIDDRHANPNLDILKTIIRKCFRCSWKAFEKDTLFKNILWSAYRKIKAWNLYHFEQFVNEIHSARCSSAPSVMSAQLKTQEQDRLNFDVARYL